MRILLVEDLKSLSDALVEILKSNKYMVDAVYDGLEGLNYALSGIYDIIILDIMLPKINGLDVLKTLRSNKIATPILLLTSKSQVEDKIQGLDTGADDYLTKPFATEELLARLRAISRRKPEFVGDILTFGDLELNTNTFELSCGNDKIRLGAKEYMVMEMLISHGKQIISKESIIEKVWGYDSEAEYNTVEVYISFLRKKLSALHCTVKIKSARGIGYFMEKCNKRQEA